MTPLEIAKTAVKALDEKKAKDIQAIHVTKVTVLADYFIIAGATSNTQAKALVDEVEFQLEQKGLRPRGIEGYAEASWIVLDYGSVVIHVFYGETREFYSLERLWADGEPIDLI